KAGRRKDHLESEADLLAELTSIRSRTRSSVHSRRGPAVGSRRFLFAELAGFALAVADVRSLPATPRALIGGLQEARRGRKGAPSRGDITDFFSILCRMPRPRIRFDGTVLDRYRGSRPGV